MKVFDFEHETTFLNQCNKWKDYSPLCYNIEEKKIKMQLIFWGDI